MIHWTNSARSSFEASLSPSRRTLRARLAPVEGPTVAELRAALKRDEFIPAFQPVVDAGTGSLFGVATTIQWAHRHWGLVPEHCYMAALVRDNLHIALAQQLLAQVFDLAAAMRRGNRHVGLFIQPEPICLMSRSYSDDVLRNLDHRGLPPFALTLAVSPSLLQSPYGQQSLHSLRRLHRAGCNLVLTVSTFDAESPPHLDALEICGIALMPELMYALRQGGRVGEACRAIAQQASAQRIPVMATGVVDEAMAQAADLLPCRYLLGDHVAPPMTGQRFLYWYYRREMPPNYP
ncbi:virulence regulation phosphodiesterase BvgR [Bordetella bronchiseptica]|uniref:Regulatory protein BvgR n=1 Tax=Bordetella bronchiseptica (strain ATCC BAA-588 / NCTC 13252 / RB50) TaxID=257310 RepID=A0A0H3LNN2_BORBR|nr:EAL domain-containing protein [Bordetella bronchiseptica]KAK67033.1 cyclic diguanylate phosphodiesterase (EAL) domain protein [Bordetella bronchiseptica 980-2]AMG89170.1 diguanylate phosphodiesterase [Bordetella bronchiseptica]KCV47669.1 cyclic diguanylate phosphodiesterase (EAL) domain protein [Bordetella bronchiseptica 3E44]KCV61230.1 cyclic diguanylate phosphodiesterase (EAL) domain protein [Bordetella bronchiseptica 980]KDB89090.1 cyclic diguanylate phosphodiesterase (EAL) domain protei